MISESFMYWLTRFNHLHIYANRFAFISGAICVIALISYLIYIVNLSDERSSHNPDESTINLLTSLKAKAKQYALAGFISCILINSIIPFIPTTKEMAAIYVIPKICNNEKLQGISDEMMSLVSEWLKELHPKNVAEHTKDDVKNSVSNVITCKEKNN